MAGYDLKNPNEVEQYLKNLYTEYLFGCQSEKNPEVCHLLGNYNDAIKQDFKEAVKIYKENCEVRNYGKSCTTYGNYVVIGKYCEKNLLEAFKYFQKGCENGDSKGCLHAGALAMSKETIEPVRKDQIMCGLKLLSKACDTKEEKACFYLSSVYLAGIEGIVEKNLKEAYMLSLKSCELGNPYGCSNVSVMHKKGDGVQQNMDLAESFRKRADELIKDMKEYKRQIKFHQGINP